MYSKCRLRRQNPCYTAKRAKLSISHTHLEKGTFSKLAGSHFNKLPEPLLCKQRNVYNVIKSLRSKKGASHWSDHF